MKSVEFCYWLQGFFELSKEQELYPDQVETIKNHLNMVFKHEIDPSYENGEELSAIHNQGPVFNPNTPSLYPNHSNGDVLLRC